MMDEDFLLPVFWPGLTNASGSHSPHQRVAGVTPLLIKTMAARKMRHLAAAATAGFATAYGLARERRFSTYSPAQAWLNFPDPQEVLTHVSANSNVV